MPANAPLSAMLQDLASQFAATETLVESQQSMLDRIFDLHNDLTDWAANTEYERAALEVMAILEQYVQASPKISTVTPLRSAS